MQTKMTRIPKCRYCGSTEIWRDAISVWDVTHQRWVAELSLVFGGSCGGCNTSYDTNDFIEWEVVAYEHP